MQQFLHPVCLVLAATGFLLLLWPPGRLRRDPALAALAAVFGLSALSFLVSLEPVWKLLDEIGGRPSTGILVAFGAVVTLLGCQLTVLAHWALPPRRARLRSRLALGAAAVVVAALAVLFFRLTPSGRSTPQGFTADYLHTGAFQAYLTLYIVTYSLGEIALVVGALAAARRAERRWVARGLRITALGALLTLGYSAVRLGGVVAALFDAKLPPGAESFAWLCADGGTLITLVGWFVPTVAVHAVPQVRVWARAHRDYRRLAPLWEAMHRAVPGIALQPARTERSARLRVWGIGWHLYRRAVEIRDGQWALQPHLEEPVRTAAERRRRAAGLAGAELASAVTADQIRAALAAHARDRRPERPARYADAETGEDIGTPDGEVRALLRIAAHFDPPVPSPDSDIDADADTDTDTDAAPTVPEPTVSEQEAAP